VLENNVIKIFRRCAFERIDAPNVRQDNKIFYDKPFLSLSRSHVFFILYKNIA